MYSRKRRNNTRNIQPTKRTRTLENNRSEAARKMGTDGWMERDGGRDEKLNERNGRKRKYKGNLSKYTKLFVKRAPFEV